MLLSVVTVSFGIDVQGETIGPGEELHSPHTNLKRVLLRPKGTRELILTFGNRKGTLPGT